MQSMEEINRALLAKVAWHLISQPDAVFSKFFMAKYYTCSSFLNVHCTNQATWGWRSILWGRDLLRNGLKWRVAKGTKIKIQDN